LFGFAVKMKISIIIPRYNEKNMIEKIVEAVCNAPLKSREIIVVDDCSKDRTERPNALAKASDRGGSIVKHRTQG
jgi:glycosyltransferase involved in cell wall biosynthesis